MFSSFFSFFYSLNVRSTHWERRCVDVGVDVDISGAPSFKYKSKRRSGRLPVGASWLSWNVHAGQKALAPRRSARISFACVCVCVCVKSARVFRTRVGSVRPHSRFASCNGLPVNAMRSSWNSNTNRIADLTTVCFHAPHEFHHENRTLRLKIE